MKGKGSAEKRLTNEGVQGFCPVGPGDGDVEALPESTWLIEQLMEKWKLCLIGPGNEDLKALPWVDLVMEK